MTARWSRPDRRQSPLVGTSTSSPGATTAWRVAERRGLASLNIVISLSAPAGTTWVLSVASGGCSTLFTPGRGAQHQHHAAKRARARAQPSPSTRLALGFNGLRTGGAVGPSVGPVVSSTVAWTVAPSTSST